MDTLSLILHVFFATILVGPMLLMALAVSPSTWLIEDEALRRAVTRVVTSRFAVMTVVALAGLLVTGLYQFYEVVPEGVTDNLMDRRFGLVFMTKMTTVVLLIGLIVAHAMVIGPRVRRASEAVERGEAEPWVLEHQRRQSLLFSLLMTVVAIVVLALGVTLGHHEYSYVLR